MNPNVLLACDCNDKGSKYHMCDSDGNCDCKSNVIGNKCTACMSGYYRFPNCHGKNC